MTFAGTAKTKIKASGITGKLGSIPAGAGKRQVTLNGWPLYYYVGDSAGQINGQGIGGYWWLVSPTGAHITAAPAQPPSPYPTPSPTPYSTASSTPSSPATSTSPPASTADLAVASTSLGSIVVDGRGMTVYAYDFDTQGGSTSACTGACSSAWPAVTVTGTPTVTGITGTVGTIAAAGGRQQLTLNGWPLYTYIGDSPGQTNGEGLGGYWWALTPAGAKVHTP